MTSNDTRTRILLAAGPVFADKGYQGATIRDICQAADVNVASVNYHFGDKQQLYIETVRQARLLRAAQVPMPERPVGTPPAVRLRDFITTMVRRMIGVQEAPWQTRLMMREILQPTRACEALVEEYFRRHFESLLGVLSELLPADTPSYRVRQIGFSVIGQCLYYRVAGKVVTMLTPGDEYAAHYDPEQLADHITRFTLAALAADGCESGRVPALDGQAAGRKVAAPT